METAILNCNCFLEAFGNSKTPMNDNSSRFGKFIKLFYRHRMICGAAMQEFLLEKVSAGRESVLSLMSTVS